MTAGKKKRHLNPKILNVLSALSLLALIVSMYTATSELLLLKTQQKQIVQSEARLQALQDENAMLLKDKRNLQDPDYIGNLARCKYFLSKEGEQLFVIPTDKD